MRWRSSGKPGREFKQVPLGQIARNPNQPRKIFEEAEILSLAASIQRYGVLNPLTVRRGPSGYELIAGERRLRASGVAGLDTVPCYVIEADSRESSLIALVENLQRRDLDCFEEAQGLLRLTQEYNLTQQQAAEQIGKSQSAVANKLRLLRLDEETVALIRKYRLTERHARALLRLPTPEEQLKTAKVMAMREMTVEQADAYIEMLLDPPRAHKVQKQGIYKDLRIFFNTLNKAVTAMRTAGVNAQIKQEEREEDVVVTIVIPARK